MTTSGDRELPSAHTQVFSAKSSRYCVVIPVLNEKPRLTLQLPAMRPYVGSLDVIICDGGSTDGSAEQEFLRSHGVRALILKDGPGRMSAQVRLLFSFALDEGYEGIIHMDGNNKDAPESLHRFAQLLNEGYDFVAGSRFAPGGKSENTPLIRSLSIRFIHAPLISLAARRRFTDTTNSFRGYSRRFLLDSRVRPFRSLFNSYNLPYYLMIRAARLGFRLIEIPVTRRYEGNGARQSKITGIGGYWGVLRELLQACTGRYNPD